MTRRNRPPVADAGPDQTVNAGSPVTLDGSQSYDLDGNTPTHAWVQSGGLAVTLAGADSASPSFVAPFLARGSPAETLTFTLTVSDGVASSQDQVQVLVEPFNHAPTADAGSALTRDEGGLVTLDGTLSQDPDRDPLAHQWTQVSGPAVGLTGADGPTPTFTAPVVGPGGVTLVFRLVVDDGLLASTPADVQVTVLNVNDPPRCDLGRAAPGLLWPPDHKLVPVQVIEVSDPNRPGVTIAITAVTQDEPVSGTGDGDTSPDAVLQGDRVLLRAERGQPGNGRVYHVHFRADDGALVDGTCQGVVTVGVPLSQGSGGAAVDDGPVYDSTQP